MLPGLAPGPTSGRLSGNVLLHFDGANASTVITDSATGRPWTAHSPAVLGTATPAAKFGTACLNTGANGWVDTPADPAFALLARDFTIDCWVYYTSGGGSTKFIAGQGDSSNSTSSWYLQIDSTKKLRFSASLTGTTNDIALNGNNALNSSIWYHVAVCRQGTTFYAFVNGADMQTGTLAGSIFNPNNALAVGRRGISTSTPWNGWIDEFRMLIGTAVWTAPFTPPAAPYLP